MTGYEMTSLWLDIHCLSQGERDTSPGEEELDIHV